METGRALLSQSQNLVDDLFCFQELIITIHIDCNNYYKEIIDFIQLAVMMRTFLTSIPFYMFTHVLKVSRFVQKPFIISIFK